MRKAIIISLLLTTALLSGWVIAEQVETKKSYVPTEVQLLRLKVMQKDAQLAQLAVREANQNFQTQIKTLMESADKVKAENGWPPSVRFDADNLVFSAPEAPEAPKENKKP